MPQACVEVGGHRGALDSIMVNRYRDLLEAMGRSECVSQRQQTHPLRGSLRRSDIFATFKKMLENIPRSPTPG